MSVEIMPCRICGKTEGMMRCGRCKVASISITLIPGSIEAMVVEISRSEVGDRGVSLCNGGTLHDNF
jgi:hypothetical protein